MHVVLAALFFFAILTLWVPAYWPVAVFQVGVFALAIRTIATRRLSGVRWREWYPCFPLTAAVGLGLGQLAARQTAYAFDTEMAVVRWATLLAVLLAGAALFGDAGIRHWFRYAMLWFGFLVAVLATVQSFTAHGRIFWLFTSGYADNPMGPILYHNHFAAFIEVVLPIAVYEALSSERDSLLYAGMAAAMFAAVIASASRAGSFLAAAEVAMVVVLMWARGRVSARSAGAALFRSAILFAVFTAVVGWAALWTRFRQPDLIQVRREAAISSLHMIADRPWFGSGLGTWPTVYPRYAILDVGAFVNQAHCDWLQWAAEGGIPFGIAMLSLFAWCVRPALRSVWGLGVIAIFLHAFVDYPFSRPALGAWPMLMVAMLIRWQSERDGGEREHQVERIQLQTDIST